jgi:hypothetical protein
MSSKALEFSRPSRWSLNSGKATGFRWRFAISTYSLKASFGRTLGTHPLRVPLGSFPLQPLGTVMATLIAVLPVAILMIHFMVEFVVMVAPAPAAEPAFHVRQ